MPKTDLLSDISHDRRDVWNAGLLRGCKFEGKYEMPALPACEYIPEKLTSFTDAKIKAADNAFIHYFEDDYKFEQIWKTPKKYLPLKQAYGGAIAPDFSVYREMPLLQQAYNIFRSRVIGYWWAKNDIRVIPSARWGDRRTYDFCFDGLPKKSVIAVGTHGCVKHFDDKRYFVDGFMKMLEVIMPKTVLVYGSTSDKIFPPLFVYGVEIIGYESDFSRSRKRMVV